MRKFEKESEKKIKEIELEKLKYEEQKIVVINKHEIKIKELENELESSKRNDEQKKMEIEYLIILEKERIAKENEELRNKQLELEIKFDEIKYKNEKENYEKQIKHEKELLLIKNEHQLKLEKIDIEKEIEMAEIKEKQNNYEFRKIVISKCGNLDPYFVEKLLIYDIPFQNSQQQNNMSPQQQLIPFMYNNNPMMNQSYQQPMNQPYYQHINPQFQQQPINYHSFH